MLASNFFHSGFTGTLSLYQIFKSNGEVDNSMPEDSKEFSFFLFCRQNRSFPSAFSSLAYTSYHKSIFKKLKLISASRNKRQDSEIRQEK